MTIAPGETGAFEVFLNRRKIFSKHTLDRFPEVNEVEEKIGEMVGTEEFDAPAAPEQLPPPEGALRSVLCIGTGLFDSVGVSATNIALPSDCVS